MVAGRPRVDANATMDAVSVHQNIFGINPGKGEASAREHKGKGVAYFKSRYASRLGMIPQRRLPRVCSELAPGRKVCSFPGTHLI